MQRDLLVGHFQRLADRGVDALGGDQAGITAFTSHFPQRELMQIGPELILLFGVEVIERSVQIAIHQFDRMRKLLRSADGARRVIMPELYVARRATVRERGNSGRTAARLCTRRVPYEWKNRQ